MPTTSGVPSLYTVTERLLHPPHRSECIKQNLSDS